MKTNITLSPNDQCMVCKKKCTNRIYDCEILTKAINNKEAEYVWCWIPKEKQ